MKSKEIELLKKQVVKLDASDFDLEAWKTGAIIILERIFGSDNQKISQIEKIKYDQSSWALREAKGSKNMMETCKKRGNEILEIAIDELDHFGMPDESSNVDGIPIKKSIIQALENELKIGQYKQLVEIIKADIKVDEKKKQLIDALNNFGHDFAENILVSILLSDETKKYL